MSVGKKELTQILSEKTNLTQKEASEFINAFTGAVAEKLAEGEKVQLVGFGTFSTRKRAARQGRSPATGETIDIPASVVPVFKPGKKLKERVNTK